MKRAESSQSPGEVRSDVLLATKARLRVMSATDAPMRAARALLVQFERSYARALAAADRAATRSLRDIDSPGLAELLQRLADGDYDLRKQMRAQLGRREMTLCGTTRSMIRPAPVGRPGNADVVCECVAGMLRAETEAVEVGEQPWLVDKVGRPAVARGIVVQAASIATFVWPELAQIHAQEQHKDDRACGRAECGYRLHREQMWRAIKRIRKPRAVDGS
jgi:hypothetical protein